MSDSLTSPAASDVGGSAPGKDARDANAWRPSPHDADIYRALVGPRTQVDRPPGGSALIRLRRWRHWAWFEGMLTRIARRAREGADRLAK